MNSSQNYGCASTGCGLVVLVVAVVAGWLVYGSLGAGFWMGLLWIALGLTALVGLVPVAGPFLYWRLATGSVMPALMASFGLTSTWLTSAALWLCLFASIFWTIVAVVVLVTIVAKSMDLA